MPRKSHAGAGADATGFKLRDNAFQSGADENASAVQSPKAAMHGPSSVARCSMRGLASLAALAAWLPTGCSAAF